MESQLLCALWTLTRQAKRDRDRSQSHYQKGGRDKRYYTFASRAKSRKEEYYRLKGQALTHLLAAGILQITEVHRFNSNYAELLEGGGYRFHRPCPAPEVPLMCGVPNLGESLESKPKGKKELGIRAALAIVRKYLEGKPEVMVYKWAKRVRTPSVVCWTCGESGHFARDCWEENFDDFEDDG